MKIALLYIALAICSFAMDQEERIQWLAERRGWLERADLIKDEETILNLSRIVRGVGSDLERASPEAREFYDKAQVLFRSTPGHAKYFTDKIDAAKKANEKRVNAIKFDADWEKQPQDSVIYKSNVETFSYMWKPYSGALSENIHTLGLIHSTESVRALGSYLQAREDPDVKYPPPTGGFEAAGRLTELIADGPMQTWYASHADIPKWRKWYDEVKAGKRTFRFVGSNVEYTLDGPADARTLERIRNKVAGDRRSAAKREHAAISGAQAATNSKRPVFYAGLIAATLLCLSALAFLYKRWNQQR